MTLEDGPHINSIEDEKVDEKGGAAKSSASLGEVKASADVQADSIQVSEKQNLTAARRLRLKKVMTRRAL